MIAACIANDGVMVEPKLLFSVTNSGISTYRTSLGVAATPLGDTKDLKEMMLSVVKSGTGKKAAIKGHKVAGKTGTAQVDIGGGQTADNAWFIGYIDEEKHPLAIAVMMEKAGSGGSNAAPAAQKVLKKALDLGY
jgi:peptidoglycan glycosyltransferase